MQSSFIEGIEYIQVPPPQKLKKAMSSELAEKLIRLGTFRLTNVLEYRKIDTTKPDQSDPYEDVGIKICQGVQCTTETLNPTFIWCCSDVKANDYKIKAIDERYNCIISINKPHVFFVRICNVLKQNSYQFRKQAGFVYYDKGEMENRKFWGDNTFQKHEKYAYQQEFRFAIKDLKFNRNIPFINLQLGNCSDILSIENHGRIIC